MYACHKKFMEYASAGDLVSHVLPPSPSPPPTPNDKEMQRKYAQQGATGWMR
jgi:hypothetical protein